jgi:flagellar assembly protein FliH
MTGSVQISLDIPISSVSFVDDSEGIRPAVEAASINEEQLKVQQEELSRVCQALGEAVSKVNESCEDILSSQREQIVRLSVQIAEKILLKEISAGNYEIEKIICEALKSAPSQQEVVVRLNSDDFQRFQEASKDHPNDLLSNISLVPDSLIGHGECVVETEKGVVEYYIDEHLKQISQALGAME